MSLQWLLYSYYLYARELHPRERWSRERLLAYQDAALRRLLRHAVERSGFYRDLYRGLDVASVPLSALPPVDKRTLMAHFDEAVTDQRLRLADLKQHLQTAGADDLYLDRYMILSTSGSSGVRGVFPYTHRAVALYLAQGIRVAAMNRMKATVPWRSVWVAGSMAAHGTYRTAAITDGGPIHSEALSADMPLPDMVARLNALQPHSISSYPTALQVLAGEQLAGRLRVAPRMLGVGGEVRTQKMDEAVHLAWPDARVMESYAMTEMGMAGGRCPTCGSIHLSEDLGIYEVVDADGRPVGPGETGYRLLVTNLFNPVLPLIRYEVTDLLTMGTGPNRCGRPWVSIKSVDGRSDEVLHLPGRDGGMVTVSPSTFRNLLGPMPGVAEYQVILEPAGLRVRVVPLDGAGESELEGRIVGGMQRRLGELGVVPPAVRVDMVSQLPRQNGKLRLVRSDVG